MGRVIDLYRANLEGRTARQLRLAAKWNLIGAKAAAEVQDDHAAERMLGQAARLRSIADALEKQERAALGLSGRKSRRRVA